MVIEGPPASGPRYPNHIDGLRGVLMTGVLLIHIFYAATATTPEMPWYNWTALWFQPGLYTVGLFVVISGYCLMLPAARANGELPGGLGRYLKRRFRRIVPPYYAAATLCLVHVLVFPSLYAPYRIPVNTRPDVIWSHLLLIYNLRPEWVYQINASYWSLAPEWQLYVLFPIVLLPVWRRWGMPGLLAAGLLGTAGLMLAGSDVLRLHPWFLLLFTCGMAGAAIASSEDPVVIRLRNQIKWDHTALALFAVFGIEWVAVVCFQPMLLSYLPPTWQQYCLNETLLGLAILAVILHCNALPLTRAAEQRPRALRVLDHPWLTGLGRFSYSHYLIHFPIVITIAGFVRHLNLAEPAALALAYLVSVPVSLSAGYVFFLAIERRCTPGYLKRTQVSVAPQVTDVVRAERAHRMFLGANPADPGGIDNR
jgi:peptidoglycan/LPS O-acetylase OafA/YrhL